MTQAVVTARIATRSAPCSSNRLSASSTEWPSNRYGSASALVFRAETGFSLGAQNAPI